MDVVLNDNYDDIHQLYYHNKKWIKKKKLVIMLMSMMK